MKNILRADFFELRKSKIFYILLGVSVLLGLLMPLMYYSIEAMFDSLSSLEALKDNPSFAASMQMFKAFDGRTVFLSSLPMTQGIGFIIAPMIGFRAVRPFSTGIYRNKVIAQSSRAGIYLSQSLVCLLISWVSAALYAGAAYLGTLMSYGKIELTGRETVGIVVFSLGVYLVYTAIPVFIAFLTRSVPLSIVLPLVLPLLVQLFVSLGGTALAGASEGIKTALTAIPGFQSLSLSGPGATDAALIVAGVSDVLITAILTTVGILRFRKADMK